MGAGAGVLGSSPGPAACWLSDLGQVTLPLCASLSLLINCGPRLTGLLGGRDELMCGQILERWEAGTGREGDGRGNQSSLGPAGLGESANKLI